MSSAPDRIYAEPPDIFDGMGIWYDVQPGTIAEYTRTDLAEAAIAAARAEVRREVLLEAELIVAELWGSARYGSNEAAALYDARDAIRAKLEVSP